MFSYEDITTAFCLYKLHSFEANCLSILFYLSEKAKILMAITYNPEMISGVSRFCYIILLFVI